MAHAENTIKKISSPLNSDVTQELGNEESVQINEALLRKNTKKGKLTFLTISVAPAQRSVFYVIHRAAFVTARAQVCVLILFQDDLRSRTVSYLLPVNAMNVT